MVVAWHSDWLPESLPNGADFLCFEIVWYFEIPIGEEGMFS
jgi:hypothetical protein